MIHYDHTFANGNRVRVMTNPHKGEMHVIGTLPFAPSVRLTFDAFAGEEFLIGLNKALDAIQQRETATC